MQEGGDHRAVAENMFPGGSFGNGAAMRVAPVGLFFHADLDRLWEQARLSALPTRVHPLGIEGAQVLAMAVALGLTQTRFDPSGVFGFWIASKTTLRGHPTWQGWEGSCAPLHTD